jgi:hypothetical protein
MLDTARVGLSLSLMSVWGWMGFPNGLDLEQKEKND